MSAEHQHTPATPTSSNVIEGSEGMKTMSPPTMSLTSSGTNPASPSPPPETGSMANATESESDNTIVAPSSTETMITLDGGDGGDGETTQFTLNSTSGSNMTAPIQRVKGPIQRQEPNEKEMVRRTITLDREVTGEEFKALALKSLFGGNVPAVSWTNVKDKYGPGKVSFLVEFSLIRKKRAESNIGKGISVDENDRVAGADKRAKQFFKGRSTKSKADLIKEMDRRYYEATGAKPGTKIKKGETGNINLWNQIRDEVLFQNEYIRDLPPKVKMLIKHSTSGKKITAADIDKLFAIAKKIEGMDPQDVIDYHSRVSGSTTDLDVFNSSLDKYIKEKAERNKDNEKREEVQKKLHSTGSIYKKYKAWKSMKAHRPPARGGFGEYNPEFPRAIERENQAEQELIADLKVAGFSSIAEFEKYIRDFKSSYEKEAINIAHDILDKYKGMLYRESERFKDRKTLEGLHKSLGGFRGHYKDFKKNADISNSRAAYDRRPGSIVTKGPPPVSRAKAQEAYGKASAAKANAKSEVDGLKGSNPILKEDHLQLDRRLDKEKMATADVDGLGKIIQDHIAARMKDVDEAKGQLDSEQIYLLPKLTGQFYAQMNIEQGSIFDEIVKDKTAEIKRSKLVVNILLTVLAIALAIISYGAATPLIAAGAAAGGLALSSYFVYDEYQEYTKQKDLADVGFADDPSMFWLIVSIAGAALDMGAAVKAVGKLGAAAKTFNASGDFAEFVKAVRSLEKAGEIESKIARAAENAASARVMAKEASADLSKIFGQGVARGFKDPDTYRALVRLASAKMKEGVSSFHQFFLELQKARKIAKISGDMTPEEIAKAKEAWDQAVLLAKSADEPAKITSTSGKVIGEFSNGSHLTITSKKTKLHGGNTIHLDTNKTTTITGTLNDTNAVATRGQRMPGATSMGSNNGGVNILRSPEWAKIQAKHKHLLDAGEELKYWTTVTEEFWQKVNLPWLEAAIKRGDNFRLVSNPTKETAIYVTRGDKFVLDASGKRIKSIFGREVDYLKSKGFSILPDGSVIPPKS